MNNPFPRSIDQVDRHWLSAALGSPVERFQVKFLEGGVLADAYRLHDIQYANGSAGGPASLVVKLPNAEDDRRAVALANKAYVKELFFYRDLAHRVPLRTPKIYTLGADAGPDPEYFVMLMEDLGTHSKVFDQVDDTPNEYFMRKITLELAEMHAQFWESDVTRWDWISDARYKFPFDASCRVCTENKDTFFDLWQTMFGADIRDSDGCGQTRAISEIVAGPDSSMLLERIYDVLSSRPFTLLHSDARADNIFRSISADDADATLTYIDWQLLGAGPPGPEFAQAWQHSIHPDLRRKDRDVLRQYHDRLVALNPAAAEYTYEMLLEDYKLGYLLWWMGLLTLGVATLPIFDKPEGARMKRLWGQGLTWMNIAMTDLDCLSVVNRLLEPGD